MLLGDGKVFVDGGAHSDEGGDCESCAARSEVFDPEASQGVGEWTDAGDHIARLWGTATLLDGGPQLCGPDCGKVLVAGGAESRFINDYHTAAELYDPTVAEPNKRWSFTTSSSLARRHHTATLLGSGRVLLAGGHLRGPIATAEVYEPLLRRWHPAGFMTTPRSVVVGTNVPPEHTAVLLSGDPHRFVADPAKCGDNCGKVLVVGGSIGSVAELYTPAPSVSAVAPASGPPDARTRVTITGTGFTHGVRSVNVDGVALAESDYTVLSHTEISALLPTAGSRRGVDVTVTTDGGISTVTPGARFSYAGLPGRIATVDAAAVSERSVRLTFPATGEVASTNPAAKKYEIRQSRAAIADDAGFEAARQLCVCEYGPKEVGEPLSATVERLTPGTTYHFAVRAVNDDGLAGPFVTASAKTLGVAPPLPPPVEEEGEINLTPDDCMEPPAPGAGELMVPTGYSIVAGPDGTVVPSDSPLYAWFDAGARGAYSAHERSSPLRAGRAYWAWLPCPSLMTLPTTAPASASMGLGAYRASMVGNPSGAGPATVAGHDYAVTWDPAADGGKGAYTISGYRETMRLPVGTGAWVFSYANTTINIRG